MGRKRNLELPELVDELLAVEQRAGGTVTRTVSAALYWYFYRMDAHQRELARLECGEWTETGHVPTAAVASAIEEALRSVKARQQRKKGSQGRGRR